MMPTITTTVVYEVRVTNDPIQSGDFLLERHDNRADADAARADLERGNARDGRVYYVKTRA